MQINSTIYCIICISLNIMAYTQEDLNNLKEALALGASEVEYAGKKTVFRSVSDLQRIIAMVEQEVNPTRRPVQRVMGVYHKNS